MPVLQVAPWMLILVVHRISDSAWNIFQIRPRLKKAAMVFFIVLVAANFAQLIRNCLTPANDTIYMAKYFHHLLNENDDVYWYGEPPYSFGGGLDFYRGAKFNAHEIKSVADLPKTPKGYYVFIYRHSNEPISFAVPEKCVKIVQTPLEFDFDFLEKLSRQDTRKLYICGG